MAKRRKAAGVELEALALAEQLGVEIDLNVDNEWTGLDFHADAPAGKKWAGTDLHCAVFSTPDQRGRAKLFSLFKTEMQRGFDDCTDAECEYCHPFESEAAKP